VKKFSSSEKLFCILLSISIHFSTRAVDPGLSHGFSRHFDMPVRQLGWHLGMPQSETEKVNFRLLSHTFIWLSRHFRWLFPATRDGSLASRNTAVWDWKVELWVTQPHKLDTKLTKLQKLAILSTNCSSSQKKVKIMISSSYIMLTMPQKCES